MIEIDSEMTDMIKEEISIGFFSDKQTLPIVIQSNNEHIDLVRWGEANKAFVQTQKEKYGAVLFRGFNINSASRFEQVIKASSSPAIKYMERSSPRDAVEGKIYTSTSHPKENEIFLHTEQSFNLTFPLQIYFNCHDVAETGGCTPLADTRKIYHRLQEGMRNELINRHYQYVRNFMDDIYVSWQDCYQTESREEVEEYCRYNQIDFVWGEKNRLTTKQVRPMVSVHPHTKEHCWFNHCTFFNVGVLKPQVQQMLRFTFSEDQFPNQTFYGDGSTIESEVIEQLRDAYEAEKVTFPWQSGDVLMVDNMLVAHGREPYTGNRLVLTGMSEPHQLSDVALGFDI